MRFTPRLREILRFVVLAVGAIALVLFANKIPTSAMPSSSHGQWRSSPHANAVLMADSNAFSTEVEQGLVYFRKRAQEQLVLAESLLNALKSGDMEAAKKAYVESRPPYEEIEVFAGSFEEEDRDIDARPYAFEEGEASSEFRGFHKIESLIYRDGDLQAAIPYGETLVASIKSLITQLNNSSNFDAQKNFKGMLALATEVPAKKISSEEETWSDQSLLIFKYNWIGIFSQYEPFARRLEPAIAREVQTTYEACMDTVAPFFQAGQTGGAPYSSVSAAQRQKIVQASYQFRSALIKARESLGLGEVS